MMESDPQQKQHQFQNPPQQQQQMSMSSSGLLRYRSAPSSYFANFADDSEGYLETTSAAARPSSPETDRIIARFMSDDSSGEIRKNSLHSPATENQELRLEFMRLPPRPRPQMMMMMYHQSSSSSSSRPPLPNNQSSKAAGFGLEMNGSPYRAEDSKMGAAAPNHSSNLVRHSSSPAGLFSHLNIENGHVRGMRNFGSINGTNGEASFSSASTLKGQINFSSSGSGPPSSSSSSSGLMTQMSDIGNKSLGATTPENGNNKNCFLAGFPVGSWEDPVAFSENFTNIKRARREDDHMKIFSAGLSASETQHGGEPGNHAPPVLSRHMSLPKTSAEMAAMETYLQFPDSVPCKVRAKRGCATHPRSIAERVRRTRISERMRKLQELVPNMDKQTSTADMLDLAVDYIKDLQNQVKALSENRAKCTCSSNNRKP